MTLKDQLIDAFRERYGETPSAIIRAPGRINLMGGHTDYNGGYVLPFNINRYVLIAARGCDDGRVELFHADANADSPMQADLNNLNPVEDTLNNIIHAAAWSLGEEEFALRGFEGIIVTDIPEAADMGLHAAFLMSILHTFAEVSGFVFEAKAMIKTAERAILDWLKLPISRADLYSVALNKPHEAILFDLQSGKLESTIPIPKNAAVVALDSQHAIDAHNLQATVEQRRQACEAVAQQFRVMHLRDLSITRFEKDAEASEDENFNKARHFLTENGRTLLAAEMLRSEALTTVGKLMNDSHASLRDDYDVRQDFAEVLVNCSVEQPNVFGARWDGRGSVVIFLVRDFSADTASKLVTLCYRKQTNADCEIYILEPVGSIEVL